MNLSEMLTNIELLKKIAKQLELDIDIVDDYVILKGGDKQFCKICLDKNANNAEKGVLVLSSTTGAASNLITMEDLKKLIDIKNVTTKQQYFVLVDMIFSASEHSIAEKIEAVLCLYETKKEKTNQDKLTIKQVKTERKSSEPIATLEYIEPIAEQLKLGKLFFAGRSLYVTEDESSAVLVMYSKSYAHSKKGPDFWFSFHPHQKERLSKFKNSYIAYCLIEEEAVIIMTFSALLEKLDFLHKTIKDDGKFYWHVRFDKINGKYLLRIPNKGREDVGGYSLHDTDEIVKVFEEESKDDSLTIIKIKTNQYKTIKKKH